jgi:hypothetical protein
MHDNPWKNILRISTQSNIQYIIEKEERKKKQNIRKRKVKGIL